MTTYFGIKSEIKEKSLPILDLRSPKEFAQGSIPGSVNLSILDDQERHEVGLCYKTQGKHEAIALGLEIFSRKAEVFCRALEASAQSTGRVVLYCWRGGMRSQTVRKLCSVLGIETLVLNGGYKKFRNEALALIDMLGKHPLIVLHGRTGVGKTEFLHGLLGEAPFLDLEGLANHRGSAFGDFNQKNAVSSQQNFENHLADVYSELSKFKRIVLEVENYLGSVMVPRVLRENILQAPVVVLTRTIEDRVRRININAIVVRPITIEVIKKAQLI